MFEATTIRHANPIKHPLVESCCKLVFTISLVLALCLPGFLYGQKGKDGALSYSPGSSTTVIANRYSALASSAAAGATSVTVANITDLSGSTSFTNSTNAFATAALSPGDLVMVIQIQGASIATTDDANYGNITAYNNTGNYELKTVLSISTNTITFCTALAKSYTVSGTRRCQVVRVPRFGNVTLGTNAVLSAKPWDGTVGGICAMEVNGNLSLSGKIDATGTGFRGATIANATITYGSTGYRSTVGTVGALKGEGIAGNQTDYASMNGQYGRGAPANGGGGGDNHNSGGGGGSNAGNNGVLTPWNGSGIKNTSTGSWATAWNLEAAGFATDVSRGGGRGGYTYGDNDQNALTTGPGNSLWGGDSRRNVGGLGGRPLDYSSNTLLFMGGGGGAGDENDSYGGGGGNGGGIVYLLVSGTVSGTGSINANGNAGSNTTGGHNDAPGGGAGGGAVVVLSNSTITGVAINANGGNGGNQLITSAENEGPGGGGGGGYILTTATSVTLTVTGGTNGTTSSSSLTEFPPNGATKGDAGTTATGSYAEVNSCFKELNSLSAPSCTNNPSSISTANTVINSYYAGTASANAGAIKISVGAIRGTTPISPGDLLLVIQMQGSTINSTNTSNYGAGAATGRGYLTTVAGTYEYVYAASGVSSGTVYLTTPLKKAYTYAAFGTNGQYTFQVIRVPEYSSLTFTGSGSVATLTWNGSTGGIIAANVTGTVTLNGTNFNAAAAGFRGGLGFIMPSTGNTATVTDYVGTSGFHEGASKGEGIAGTPQYTYDNAGTSYNTTVEGYPGGSSCRGAPGNAGGGGNDAETSGNFYQDNTGGGGGANGGVGGHGGRGWANPVDDVGGIGGANFAQVSATRLVMGGGGGAGTTNTNATTSSGATGGGMVFLKANAMSGTGTITVAGGAGQATANEGAGGGGAGGSVYIYATNTAGLANLTINAAGGKGGNAWPGVADAGAPNDGNPEHGPGGGGGGGVIYTNGTINGASSVAGGANGTTTTSNLAYFATAGTTGLTNTSATNPISIIKTFCDIDDDDDGIADIAENPSGVDPFLDADNDGVPNAYDATSGTAVAWADTNGDQINDNFDKDKDGIINELDLDSDNDGIADVVESYGVDADGDGLIDNYTDANGDGLSDNAAATSATLGLGAPDFDGDGIPNFLDLDSDGDGVPDVLEVQGTDANNDGLADSFIDTNFDGINDNLTGATNALLRSGADTNNDGVADSWPYKNIDQLGRPNPYDLDSDGDGILDMVEAGLSGTNGIASGADANLDGWSDTVDALVSLTLPNTDGVGLPNLYDIDSDNDGITDNIEAQSTGSYKIPSDVDTDGDGINDIYELPAQIGIYGGGGLTPFDYDNDGTPDYMDTDSDNDGAPDRNEGDRNSPFRTITQATIDASGDSDGDGLMDVFDNVNIGSLTAGNFYKNVTMSNMGALGDFNGPTPSGSYIQLQQSDPAADRDWRNVSVLPLQIVNFTVNYQAPTATLKWNVVNELQTNYYELQVSTNGTNFSWVTNVTAKNTGNANYAYAYSINNQTSNVLYYRIKQVDKDGKWYYTPIVIIKLNNNRQIEVSPNPFTNYINISYISTTKEKLEATLFSAEGKLVTRKPIDLVKGTNLFQITALGNLPAGNYMLQLKTAIETKTIKLLKF